MRGATLGRGQRLRSTRSAARRGRYASACRSSSASSISGRSAATYSFCSSRAVPTINAMCAAWPSRTAWSGCWGSESPSTTGESGPRGPWAFNNSGISTARSRSGSASGMPSRSRYWVVTADAKSVLPSRLAVPLWAIALWNRTVRRGHGEQCRHGDAAGGLAEDRDVARVAAEALDVVVDPLQRGDLVQLADVGGRTPGIAAVPAEIEVPERSDAVVDRHHDDVAAFGQRAAVVRGLRSRSVAEPAAVDPEQHRSPCTVQRRRVHVERQAVLALGDRRPETGRDERVLRGGVAELDRVARAGPRVERLGCGEATVADRRLGERHAEEGEVVAALESAQGAERGGGGPLHVSLRSRSGGGGRTPRWRHARSAALGRDRRG